MHYTTMLALSIYKECRVEGLVLHYLDIACLSLLVMQLHSEFPRYVEDESNVLTSFYSLEEIFYSRFPGSRSLL